MILLKRIPKRSITIYPGEIKEILFFLFSKSLNINEGNFIKGFENKFKEYIGTKEAIAISSGRFAMTVILKNLGLKKGDGIILSAYNFSGVPKALLQEGFCLQFIDAHKSTYQMDVDKIESVIDKNTKAIIATHLFGQPCNLDKILVIAKKYKLFVIEDAAHSLGSIYQNRFTASLGDAGFFSFSGSKTFNTCFGGMVVTNDSALATRIRNEVRSYDFPKRRDLMKEIIKKYIYALLTKRTFYTFIEYPIILMMNLFNVDPLEIYKNLKKSEITEKKFKFTNLQALIGMNQMYFIKGLIEQRKRIANCLIENLSSSISVQVCPPESEPNYFMFPIKTKDKHKVFRKLLFGGIDSNISYASDCSYLTKNNSLPIAHFLSDSILTINLPFDLKEKEVLYIANTLNEIKDWLY